MARVKSAVHRAILVVDVEAFGDQRRTNRARVAVRNGLYKALRQALRTAGIRWADCHREDCGDGVLVLTPSETPKSRLVEVFPGALANAVRQHNDSRSVGERMRLRLALHAGEVIFDDHGVTALAVNVAFRMLDANQLRRALAASSGLLGLIVSEWFFDEVVRHSPAAMPASYRPVLFTVKETTAIGWICLPDNPYPAHDPDSHVLSGVHSPAQVVPRQLPSRPGVQAVRHRELDDLTRVLATAPICVLSGAGGTGKTTLALHWAHNNADRFPDGQLFVNLRGFDPTGRPTPPAVVLRGFLAALGVAPAAIPADAQAQVGLYRSLLVGRHMLVVLDNARNTEQVEALLPGDTSCTALITTRQWPADLAMRGVDVIDLEALSDGEARNLLAERVGAARLAAEPAATQQMLAACGGLPLALAIVAARVRAHPQFTLRVLADELQEVSSRLDAMEHGETTSLRAVMSWSVAVLGPDAALAFRLLGLLPDTVTGLGAAASLTGHPPARARQLMVDLEAAHLVQQHQPDRFRAHDLVHIYAAERAAADVPAADRDAALRRLVDFYLHTAHIADRLLYPHRTPVDPPDVADGTFPLPLADEAAALRWFTEEHRQILAVQRLAMDHGWLAQVWQLARTLDTYQYRRGLIRENVESAVLGAEAADSLGSTRERILAYRQLGRAYTRQGELTEAVTALRHALLLSDQHGSPVERAHTHYDLGRVHSYRMEHHLALSHANSALTLYQATGNRAGAAHTLNAQARHHTEIGDYEHARRCGEAALELHDEIGNAAGRLSTLNTLGLIAQRTGKHADASGYYALALSLCRQQRNDYVEAEISESAADVHHAMDQRTPAREALERAHTLYRNQHRATDAARVRHKLVQWGLETT